jgi:hypothetical protein
LVKKKGISCYDKYKEILQLPFWEGASWIFSGRTTTKLKAIAGQLSFQLVFFKPN